ncbi:stage III sporulation protein AA [Sporolactobacillus kofuensis]|uniref:Stage III sporulation protein AA n=1 Tax=Sporolactobacillus kofuensis TaxID=269672 RepID=A0ABW1WJS0_9BACL|nr:stage III sporulation protein AA [Sporolactobacillus kofuensis]MCO7176586.1 stage III sporulation protein AA [Sporolactobacillus kofuensis]
MDQILPYLPESVQQILLHLPEKDQQMLEEIRCRTERPLELIVAGQKWVPTDHTTMPVFQKEQAKQLLQKIGNYSIYTLEEELKRGYVTIPGGHRIGLSGRVLTEQGRVLRLRDVTFFNIRLAKQKIGAALPLVPYLYNRQRWLNTLLIGAPQTGKTTMLRDIARLISEGIPERYISSRKTAIVDERSEIAGCVEGVPQNRLGMRTDVMDACPKAEGMMMMIRSMSPEVMVVDEIGGKDDTAALFEALNAGVTVMATAHGFTFEQLSHRPSIKPLIDAQLFDRYVILSRRHYSNKTGCRIIILDQLGRKMTATEGIWQ